ncbi:hypothetical protein IE53DRAFT_95384 [Violaceomyces palustris]|uniref:Uncharacterized protein n=1 Tax=Violaceomyces palustris TaxID=1673888 RepID=A0ACD0NXI0_9BASI|nr:hypothetical protein IE53DRAFT_95384 [Violaceomyces palustris]
MQRSEQLQGFDEHWYGKLTQQVPAEGSQSDNLSYGNILNESIPLGHAGFSAGQYLPSFNPPQISGWPTHPSSSILPQQDLLQQPPSYYNRNDSLLHDCQPPYRPEQGGESSRSGSHGIFLPPGPATRMPQSQPLQVPVRPDSRSQSPSSVSAPAGVAIPYIGNPVRKKSSSAASKGEERLPSTLKGPSLNKVYAGPIMRPRSLDDIAPRQTFLSIIALYYHYLWPLLPIVNRPSFSHDLVNRRDERDDTFLAFVLSLTAYTLIQAPRTVIPAPWSFYRKLHRICHATSRRMQPRRYDPPNLLHISTLYCDHIYLGSTGQNNAANAVLGEAIRVAYTLGIHDDRRYGHHPGNHSSLGPAFGLPASTPSINSIEKELRKRLFWVLHGSSTTIAVLQDEPLFIRDIDTHVDPPLAIDDDALCADTSAASRLVDDPNRSMLCGFVTVSRLHQLLSELLESCRRDRRFPPSDLAAAKQRLLYIKDVLNRVRKTLRDMPEQLKKPAFTHQPPPPARKPGSGFPDVNGPSNTSSAEIEHQRAVEMQPNLPVWPWPADAFTKDGLPNADIKSASSAQQSPRATPVGSLLEGSCPMTEGNTRSLGSSGPPSVDGKGGYGNTLSEADKKAFNGPNRLDDSWSPAPSMDDFTFRAGLTSSLLGMGIQGTSRNPPVMNSASMEVNAAYEQVNAFRPSPPPQANRSAEPILSPLCTLHANVIVTEAMIRFVIVEYRELITAQVSQLQARTQPQISGADRLDFFLDESEDGWEAAAKDMLDVLHEMPLEALASNGQSMVAKIIYVVSSLLNRTATNTRGYSYMTSFLHMLTKLSQDRSAEEDEGRDDISSCEEEMPQEAARYRDDAIISPRSRDRSREDSHI